MIAQLEQENKNLFVVSLILGAIVDTLLIAISLFGLISYKVAVSFLIGFLTGNAMHYLTIRVINKARVESYRSVVKQLTITKQLIYALTLIAIYLITKQIWSFVACVLGIMIIKIAIVIFVLMEKKHG